MKKIYLDLDGVIFDSIKTITWLYNQDYKHYENFKEIFPRDVNSWDFHELTLANKTTVDNYFNQERFFQNLYYFSCVTSVLKDIIDKNNYKIIFVSMGDAPNLRAKQEWVKKYYPKADFIGLNIKIHSDKSKVDMSDGILFIDDVEKNLTTSNCPNKVCFGKVYEWNKNWKGQRLDHWVNFKEMLKNMEKNNNDIIKMIEPWYNAIQADIKITNDIFDASKGSINLYDISQCREIISDAILQKLELNEEQIYKFLDDMYNGKSLNDAIAHINLV